MPPFPLLRASMSWQLFWCIFTLFHCIFNTHTPYFNYAAITTYYCVAYGEYGGCERGHAKVDIYYGYTLITMIASIYKIGTNI